MGCGAKGSSVLFSSVDAIYESQGAYEGGWEMQPSSPMQCSQLGNKSGLDSLRSSLLMHVIHSLFLYNLPTCMEAGLGSCSVVVG